MITEIWFKKDDASDEVAIRLPVLPSEYERVTSTSYEDSSVLSLGNVATFKSNGLTKMSFSSFFPAKYYPFCAYTDIKDPYDYVSYLKDWKNKGTVVRVILTGTDINQQMKITDFTYGEKDGTGDVYYTVDFVEHRQIIVPKITTDTVIERPNKNTTNVSNTTVQRTYKVVKGDCLWNIAQKYYGKGSEYPKIQNANISKYPSLKSNPNYIQIGWELIIP